MNYIGSKHSLLPQIAGVLADHGITGGTFLDAFAGTTVVGQMAKRLGFSTLSNDIQHYSYVLQQAFLVNGKLPRFTALLPEIPTSDRAAGNYLAVAKRFGLFKGESSAWQTPTASLVRVLAYLNGIEGTEGPFFHAYCEGGAAGRNYFSAENGARAQAIRDEIAAWRVSGRITDPEYYILLASLLETMDQVANTASVYAAYLKHVKASARHAFTLRIPALLLGRGVHRAHDLDADRLIDRLRLAGEVVDVLYLDPPYNQRQYTTYYHLLETLARWDLEAFEPRGKTGLRPTKIQNSRFCSRTHAETAMADLIARAPARYILVSYSNEGLIPDGALREILASRAERVDFRKVDYRRFRADNDSATRVYKGDAVSEYLYFVTVRSTRCAPSPFAISG